MSCRTHLSDAADGDLSVARLRPLTAWIVLTALVGLIALGCVQGAQLEGARGGPPGNDSGLFVRVVEHLRAGEGYYPAITREHRLLAYPLRPVVTVRLPTLAWAMAALPAPSIRALCVRALAAASFAAWLWRLRPLAKAPVGFALATLVLGAAHAPALISFGYSIHELWAGLLISLSLALYRPSRWWLSLLIALAALAIRELAAPFLLAMSALAWREGRRGEAAAWLGGLGAFALALVAHAAALAPYVSPADHGSPGWLGLHGWRFVLLQMKWNLLLMTTPDWAAAVLAPLALASLACTRGPLAERLLFVVGGYVAAFLIVGRPDNAYWGLMIAPLWPIGLYCTALVVGDLARGGASRRLARA